MKANYHTHTPRCNHARGEEIEYIQAAIERGLDTLGFSDHTPYFFPGDYYSHFRMRPELLADYVHTLRRLKQEYAGQIQLHIGLEAEYYPKYFSRVYRCWQEHEIEYLILGQHFVGNEPDGQYSGTPTADDNILKEYCHQLMDGMQTGLFSYIAHPDIINYQGNPTTFRRMMGEVVREAKQCHVPLELNLLGVRECRQYPSRRFLELVGEENAPMILGVDAHTPEVLKNTHTELAARDMAAEFGITLLDYLELKPINALRISSDGLLVDA